MQQIEREDYVVRTGALVSVNDEAIGMDTEHIRAAIRLAEKRERRERSLWRRLWKGLVGATGAREGHEPRVRAMPETSF